MLFGASRGYSQMLVHDVTVVDSKRVMLQGGMNLRELLIFRVAIREQL